MYLTDNELCALEQLCYLDNNVAKAAGVNSTTGSNIKGKTVSQILANYDEAALKRLESLGNTTIDGALTSAAEWASIIRYLKKSKMKDLVVTDLFMQKDTNKSLAICYKDPKSKNNDAIVAFKGTTGDDEWADNASGFNKSDTQCQKDALDFIESLPYSNITVTGHSKGSNKAMYVTITSNKITRCVGFDGQGFSKEFIDRYWAEIQKKGHLISNYSLATDFVHILMFPIPNSNQIYCKAFGVDDVGQHHSPNSFFVTDSKGNIIFDENGCPQVIITDEDESMKILHNFTTFILNNAKPNEKDAITNFMSNLLSKCFSSSADEIIKLVTADPDTLAMVVAYLVKYMGEYDLDSDDVNLILKALGIDELNQLVNLAEVDIPLINKKLLVNLNLANIINLIKKQLTDDDDDFIIKNLVLKLLKKIFFNDIDIDISAFWQKISDTYEGIENKYGCKDYEKSGGKTWDFSTELQDILFDIIEKIENVTFDSISSWDNYKYEEWFGQLGIELFKIGINAYYSNLSDTNTTCKSRMETILNNVANIDNTYSGRIDAITQNIYNFCSSISDIENRINFKSI